MSTGIRLTDKDSSPLVQSVVGVSTDPTTKVVRVLLDDLAQQLIAGPIGDEIAAAAQGEVHAETWAALSAIVGTRNGQPGMVPSDAGTHTDPVAGGTVANAGVYRWVTASGAWRRIGNIIDTSALQVAIDAKTDKTETTKLYRAALDWFTGDVGTAKSYPTRVSADNRAIDFMDETGITQDVRTSLNSYRSSLSSFWGDSDSTYPPTVVSLDNRVLATVADLLSGGTSGMATAVEPDTFGYVSAGTLRAIGRSAGDRLLNSDAGKTWVSASPSTGGVQAIYSQGGLMHFVRVGDSGDAYYDGEWTGWVSYGQSNAEAQSGADTALLRTTYPYFGRLMMPLTAAANVWLGLVTSAGASDPLAGNAITGLMPLKGSLGDSTHGTTSIESAALRQCTKADGDCGGVVPKTVVWTGAEGGQNIAALSKGAATYAYSNMVSAVSQVVSKLPVGERLVMRWMEMVQGENDTADDALGAKHDAVRADFSADFAAATGQTVPLRMVSFQPSSFTTNSNGVRSILGRHILMRAAAYSTFLCGGPTYPFPFTTDFLHATSLGHDQRGELLREIIRIAERTGYCDPLYMLSATITSTSEITVTLSEAAVLDTTDAVVAAVANAGITVPGRTVTNVAVSGTSMVITLSAPAAGATAVQAALVGQQTGAEGGRIADRIPRTNIRSAASLGTYRSGRSIRKWLCHQEIAIS